MEKYFADLVDSHSWSTVKIDRCGLQFFWKYVLKLDWKWVDIVKPPQVKTIPDIFTPSEIEKLIAATRKLRYRVFILTTYSMGPRLEKTLSLQVGDIDASPETTASYAHITDFTEQNSLLTMNRLMNTLHVSF